MLKVLKDADFWFYKGIMTDKEGFRSAAIDCYKQALLLNQNHFPSMFNVATCYQRQKKFKSSCKWFIRLVQIKPEMD